MLVVEHWIQMKGVQVGQCKVTNLVIPQCPIGVEVLSSEPPICCPELSLDTLLNQAKGSKSFFLACKITLLRFPLEEGSPWTFSRNCFHRFALAVRTGSLLEDLVVCLLPPFHHVHWLSSLGQQPQVLTAFKTGPHALTWFC